VERMSFRERQKYFEQEIQQQSRRRTDSSDTSASNGSMGSLQRNKRNKISLVSDQDLATMKQEEAKKLSTLSRDELRKSVIADEEFDDDSNTPTPTPQNDDVIKSKDEKKPVARTRLEQPPPVAAKPNVINIDDINSLEFDVTQATVDTDNENTPAKSTLTTRLPSTPSADGATEQLEDNLSPSERRALEAEKRKQYRQAKFKSLEADALQAQMVMTKEKLMQRENSRKQSSNQDSNATPAVDNSNT